MSEITTTYIETVGELRAVIAAFDDSCPLHGDLRLGFTLLLTGGYMTAEAPSTTAEVLERLRNIARDVVRQRSDRPDGALTTTSRIAMDRLAGEVS